MEREIGFITGVFDLLHRGHIDLIEKAKNEVNNLIVGVESDFRVNLLKGDNRPYHHEQKRKERLAKIFPDVKVMILSKKFGEEKVRQMFLKENKVNHVFLASNDQLLKKKMIELKKNGVKVKIIKVAYLISSTQILKNKELMKYLVFEDDKIFYE